MKIHVLQGRSREGVVSFGGYWNRGEAAEGASFVLNDAQGAPIPVQSQAAAYWPDGSIKWSRHVAPASRIGDNAELAVCPSPVAVSDDDRVVVSRNGNGWSVATGHLSFDVPAPGEAPTRDLLQGLTLDGKAAALRVHPVFELERRDTAGNSETRTTTRYEGVIDQVSVEEDGPVQAVFRFEGRHIPNPRVAVKAVPTGPDDPVDMPEPAMPFVIRLFVGAGERDLRFEHTFQYDGKDSRDFLKGMGIRFETPLTGHAHEHHAQFAIDDGVFHEAAEMFFGNHWDQSPAIVARQLAGDLPDAELSDDLRKAEADLPVWNRFALTQDASTHYRIAKRTHEGCCEITCAQGRRAPGVMAVTGPDGGLILGMRDFWRKYPGELEVEDLGGPVAQVTAWFHAPDTEAYDFRHYDTRSYPYTCYEGFDYMLATAYGVAVTSEMTARFTSDAIPAPEALAEFAAHVDKPAVAVGDPAYYHAKRAFGDWSLPADPDGKGVTRSEAWLESQLDKVFSFYRDEVEHRDWYGLFDYGDVMHTYDPARHVWRYDVGGFAWQNTELIPTYWLWTYFLRTGREDVFSMAEAMTRHCSEVDLYHFGPLKGLGTRHNVRHWGCSCKEPRIAMAGHHRFYFYLSGGCARVGEVMDEVLDVDETMHARGFGGDGKTFDATDPHMPVRSGPDWSSFVSNWMTAYERTLDPKYRQWIERGVEDIAKAPYRLISGPSFIYDVNDKSLGYMGEDEGTPNQHLQLCQGGIQVWSEVADALDNRLLKDMLIEEGSFYTLPPDEKYARSQSKELAARAFSWPSLITEILGLAAGATDDERLGRLTWDVLFTTALKGGADGYTPTGYRHPGGNVDYPELAWNSTNLASRWALGVIDCLETARQWLPEDVPERASDGDWFH